MMTEKKPISKVYSTGCNNAEMAVMVVILISVFISMMPTYIESSQAYLKYTQF